MTINQAGDHTMMRHTATRIALLAAALTVMTAARGGAAARAQDQEPPKTTSEKIKSKVDSAVESLKKGAASAEDAVRAQWTRARAAVTRMGIEARVYARIHWDKSLTDATIDLSAPKPGSIVLSGTVADEKAHARAAELTRETVGVTDVTDHLTVKTATTDAPVPLKP
jgi:hypothetical protein